jgi:hypothetical protein
MKFGRTYLLMPGFLLAFFDFFSMSAWLRYARAKAERFCAASVSEIARDMRSAFSACFRKNFASLTIAKAARSVLCHHTNPKQAAAK